MGALQLVLGLAAGFGLNKGPWWRLEENERAGEIHWMTAPGFCGRPILDISKLDAAENAYAAAGRHASI